MMNFTSDFMMNFTSVTAEIHNTVYNLYYVFLVTDMYNPSKLHKKMYYTEKKLFLAYLLEIIFCLFDLEIHVLTWNVTLNYYQNSTIAGLSSKNT